MKKTIVFSLLLLWAASFVAHPASNVSLSFDPKTDLLTVEFQHSVKNPADHYINSVTIKVNGKEVITQSPWLQEDLEGGSLVYKVVGVKKGTQIEAVTKCSKSGNKSAKLTVK